MNAELIECTTDTITVTRWWDPIVDAHGNPARSAYVERFWLPVLGPTATLLLRRLVFEVEAHGHVAVVLPHLAQSMGLSFRVGRHSPFTKALCRLQQFGLMRVTATGLEVRCTIPDVPRRHLDRFCEPLRIEHDDVTGVSA